MTHGSTFSDSAKGKQIPTKLETINETITRCFTEDIPDDEAHLCETLIVLLAAQKKYSGAGSPSRLIEPLITEAARLSNIGPDHIKGAMTSLADFKGKYKETSSDVLKLAAAVEIMKNSGGTFEENIARTNSAYPVHKEIDERAKLYAQLRRGHIPASSTLVLPEGSEKTPANSVLARVDRELSHQTFGSATATTYPVAEPVEQ